MAEKPRLPRWRSHKEVEAAPIERMEPGKLPDSHVRLYLAGGVHVDVDRKVFARGMPVIGDYFVRYADGYESWSPRKAFEEGYGLIGDEGIEAPGKLLD